MTTSARETFIKLLGELAKLTNAPLSPMILEIYDKALSPIGYDVLIKQTEKFIVTRSSRDPLPSVNDFKDALGMTPLTDEQKAIDVSQRMIAAIRKHGYCGNLENIEKDIGEIGMQIAKQRGGWARFCESTDHLTSLETFTAQLRNEIIVALKKQKSRTLELPPTFSNDEKIKKALSIACGNDKN